VTHFRILHPLNFSGMAGDRIVTFYALVGPGSITLMITNCNPSGRGQDHVTSKFYGKISVNISKTVQDRDIPTMED